MTPNNQVATSSPDKRLPTSLNTWNLPPRTRVS